jgi:KH domain
VAFSYPNEYALVPVPAALLSQLVGDAATGGKGGGKASGGDATEAADDSLLTLAKLAAKTEAKLWPNTDGGYVTVCGSPAQVASAKTALTDFVAAAADRYAEVPLEEWMIPIVVGPKGAKIMELQQSSGARLDVDKQKLLVTIQGSNKEAITSAKTTLTELIHRLAAQRVVLKSTPAAVMAIIGRGGTTIRRLQVQAFPLMFVLFWAQCIHRVCCTQQDETGAMIDVNRDTGVVTVRGSDALLVQTAVERVKALLADTPSDGAVLSADAVEKRVTVDKRSIAVVIGAGGSTVRRLQDETGARISIDRVSPLLSSSQVFPLSLYLIDWCCGVLCRMLVRWCCVGVRML